MHASQEGPSFRATAALPCCVEGSSARAPSRAAVVLTAFATLGRRLEGVRDDRRAPGLAIVAGITLYLSTQMLFQKDLLAFWTPVEVAVEWLRYLGELAVLAALLYAAYLGTDAACRRLATGAWWRLAAVAAALYAAAVAFMLFSAALRNRFAVAPDIGLAASLATRWAVVGVYAVAVQAIWQRVRETDAQAFAAEATADALARERQHLRLQLLRAQIEPHFLFNTLANVRRLYQTEPGDGERMMASLKCYLHAALPGLRRDGATLAEELGLVRAYLALIAVRMGSRLAWRVDDASGCGARRFPSMIVLTLVENAIRHGLEASPTGGRVDVAATLEEGRLTIRVRDDGVGLGGADTGGTGVGLANIRNQLLACYGAGARLMLVSAEPGVLATIVVPSEAL